MARLVVRVTGHAAGARGEKRASFTRHPRAKAGLQRQTRRHEPTVMPGASGFSFGADRRDNFDDPIKSTSPPALRLPLDPPPLIHEGRSRPHPAARCMPCHARATPTGRNLVITATSKGSSTTQETCKGHARRETARSSSFEPDVGGKPVMRDPPPVKPLRASPSRPGP